jgi:glycosyltransferase involved in cell wall biosynthesis
MVALTNHDFIFSRHNAEPFFPGAPKNVSKMLSRFVSHRAKFGIAISKAVYSYLRTSGEVSSKCDISVVYYGIDPVSKRNEVVTNSLNTVPRIGTISRLVPQKDLVTLIGAHSIILSEFPNAELLIVGSGPLEESLRDYAKSLGVEDRIKWMGRMHDTEDFYLSISTFVLSSVYEGFGLVLLEAMNYGVPIVATNTSAIPEVIGSEHPLISEKSNPESFADGIRQSLLESRRNSILDYQSSRLEQFRTDKLVISMDSVYSKI